MVKRWLMHAECAPTAGPRFTLQWREKGQTPGYRPRVIEGKGSLRSVWQAQIELDGVRVPATSRLPGANSFKDTGKVLASDRKSVV